MIFGLLYFCVVILCVNRSRSSFIMYRIVKRHSRQSNVRRIWTFADKVFLVIPFTIERKSKTKETVKDNDFGTHKTSSKLTDIHETWRQRHKFAVVS